MKALKAILNVEVDIIIYLIIVNNISNSTELISLSSKHDNLNVIPFNNNVAKIMRDCDIAIGGLGTTTWERCFLGIPSLIVTNYDNQKHFLKYLQSINMVYDLGNNLNKEKIEEGFKFFGVGTSKFIQNRKNLLNTIDGLGVNRISKEIVRYV